MSTTVVSCYYRLNQSKHSMDEYMVWIAQFLANIDTPIVMFSDGEEYNIMCDIREQANLSDKFFPIRKPLADLKFSTPEWIQTWTHQVEKSKYKHLHNEQLFRIWANKSFFVEEAIQHNPFESDTFVWCDAGCWRDPRLARAYGKGWPSMEALKPGCLLLLTMTDLQPLFDMVCNPTIQTIDDVVTKIPTQNLLTISGSILAGDKEAWMKWTPIFQSVLETFIKHDLFAGDDQSVITSTLLWLLKVDQRAFPVIFCAPPGNGFVEKDGVRMGDHWFALQVFLSQEFKNRLH
jgi:hypothetical protein